MTERRGARKSGLPFCSQEVREEEINFMNKIKERGMKIVFMVAACASVLAVFLICLFLFASGIPALENRSFWNFFLEQNGGHPTICMEFFQ